MVFSVLDKQTIQCVMSEKEIADYGMDKRTIYQNDARTADFFREIMNRAQQETGFTKKGGSIAVHAAFLADESLEITFSIEMDTCPPEIETAILKAKSLHGIIDFCARALFTDSTSLYAYEGSYFLLADVRDYKLRDMAVLFYAADEYMDGICYTKSIAAFVKEHGRCIITGNAAEVLGSL